MFATAYLLVIRQITGFFKEYSASSVQISRRDSSSSSS